MAFEPVMGDETAAGVGGGASMISPRTRVATALYNFRETARRNAGHWMRIMSTEYGPLEPQPIEVEETRAWNEAAVGARLNAEVLLRIMPPREGSFLRPNSDDPLRNMAWFCHGLLESAADHLVLWADYAAPLKFHPDHVTVHALRPVFTLARAAIESASQAIWVLSPEDPKVRGARYIMLATWDLNEQLKAAVDEESRAELKSRRDSIFAALGVTARTFRPPRYLDMIREATEFLSLAEPVSMTSAGNVERVWRCAAAAAHGKHWPEFELHDRTEVDDGLFSSVPKIGAMSEVLEVADCLLSASVVLFAMHAGRIDDHKKLWDEAAQRLAAKVTPASTDSP